MIDFAPWKLPALTVRFSRTTTRTPWPENCSEQIYGDTQPCYPVGCDQWAA